MSKMRASILFSTLFTVASGFSINHVSSRRPSVCTCYSSPSHNDINHSPTEEDEICSHHSNNALIDRRKWIASQVLASSYIVSFGANANAEGSADDSTAPMQSASRVVPRDKSIIVLGANGGTGKECVSAVLASGRSCVATSRSGTFNYDEEENSNSLLLRSNSKITEAQADVTNLDSLLSIVDQVGESKIGAMIFAASASVKGKTPGVNDAYTVDRQGVINAAQCCIQRNIPRLVIVSSGAVTRPDSSVYKLLNFVGGGIMEAKIQGEDAVRELYRDSSLVNKGLGYTVVRPGGLTTEPALGPAFLELNQGDDKSGRLSRADVAGICIACLESESAFDATFECYELNTAKGVNNVGLSNILRSTDPTSYKSGRECTGETWDALFGGLESDFV
eukprot:CAMPEP_0183709858 /NCGR_PEP_ID=MMETSP0737-20130205/5821_1 /TAXON_ID=385413 /ORGANISM="Thalassiosira miniscula, Strain CCMP1093" /LENGTH=392 /DNA_ID=CAMNT_0025938071 /DNA_START=35 /DNA_END=1213 /DNA_ORIENTATION=-